MLHAGCELRTATAAVANGIVYAACGDKPDKPAYAEAISATSGKLLWRLTFGTVRGASISTPVVANGVAYIEAFDVHAWRTTIEAVGAASGKVLWTARLPIRIWRELAVAEGKLSASLTTRRDRVRATVSAPGLWWPSAPARLPLHGGQRGLA